MSYARFYQHGVKAHSDDRPLSQNPHNVRTHADAHEGWNNGWLDASAAYWRRASPDFARSSRCIQIDRFIAAREYLPEYGSAH